LLEDDFNVEFFPEFTSKGLVAGVSNKVYFQVLQAGNSTDFVDFYKAQLLDG